MQTKILKWTSKEFSIHCTDFFCYTGVNQLFYLRSSSFNVVFLLSLQNNKKYWIIHSSLSIIVKVNDRYIYFFSSHFSFLLQCTSLAYLFSIIKFSHLRFSSNFHFLFINICNSYYINIMKKRWILSMWNFYNTLVMWIKLFRSSFLKFILYFWVLLPFLQYMLLYYVFIELFFRLSNAIYCLHV